jgi:hypothetical protein
MCIAHIVQWVWIGSMEIAMIHSYFLGNYSPTPQKLWYYQIWRYMVSGVCVDTLTSVALYYFVKAFIKSEGMLHADA